MGEIYVLVLFMASATEMNERHAAGLAELADLGLSLARDLHARALAATDERAACDLSLAFHRISRSVRQTYALEARLEREARQALRERQQDAAKARLARVQQRRAQVRHAISPLVWTEAEGEEEAEAWFVALEGALTDASFDDDFLEDPIETCIERIRADLGLPAANAGTPGEAEPAAEPPDVVIWKSSG